MANKDNKTDETPLTREEVQKLVQEAAATSAAEAVKALMPAVASIALQKGQAQVVTDPRNMPRPPIQRCDKCGQNVKACKDDGHVQMVVYPTKYPEFGDWFMGVFINGVRYLSNNAAHAVTVPRVAKSDILGMIRTWETNERELKLGRKRKRVSGNVGNGGLSRSSQPLQYFR